MSKPINVEDVVEEFKKEFSPKEVRGIFYETIYSIQIEWLTETLTSLVQQSKEEAFKEIFDIGHNDDCMFCGFKDRKCREFLSNTP